MNNHVYVGESFRRRNCSRTISESHLPRILSTVDGRCGTRPLFPFRICTYSTNRYGTTETLDLTSNWYVQSEQTLLVTYYIFDCFLLISFFFSSTNYSINEPTDISLILLTRYRNRILYYNGTITEKCKL